MSGAVFLRLEEESLDSVRESIAGNRRYSEFKSFATRETCSWILLRRYNRTDNVPCWMPVRENPGDPLTLPKSLLAELSQGKRQIIAYFYCEQAIDFQHWRNGELLRFIDGSEEGWDTLAGEPEPWEEECFFPTGGMEKRMEALREFDELTSEREQAIWNAWTARKLFAGATEPPTSIREMLQCLKKHYGIWLFD